MTRGGLANFILLFLRSLLMRDQAHRLRELIDLPSQADLEHNRANIVTVCGGTHGVLSLIHI